MLFDHFERQINPLAAAPLDRPPETAWGFFVYFLSPHKRVLIMTLLLAGIAATTELFLYQFLGQILDWMVTAKRETFFQVYGWPLLAMVVIAAVIRPLAMWASRGYITLALAPGLSNSTRWQNHRYVLRQSLVFFQNDFAGRVAQKVLQTGNSLRESVLNIIDGVWLMLIYLAGIVWLFVDIQYLLLIPVVLWVVCYGLVIVLMVPPVRGKSAALSEANSMLTGRIVDSYTNIQSVKLFAHAEHEEKFAADGIAKHTYAFRVLMRAVLNMTGVLIVLNTLLLVGVAWLSIVLWQANIVTVGEIAIANGLILRLNQMSGWILRTITSLFEHVGTVQNGIETISQPMSVVDSNTSQELNVRQGKVEFDSVDFKYDEKNIVVRDCKLTIKAGEKVGLVGRSGAGKSTLVNLLLRFYEVDSGEIRIDDQDIKNVSQNSLRKNIAMVTQDTSLLHRSIKDNISYGKVEAGEADVLRAAQLAEAMDFIPTLVDSNGREGFDAFVGERGVTLSGGQRQRIAIARVILKDAPILILDEATSALDSEIEAAIQGQLNALMQNKTVIAVAHRLSTIAALDRLVVLDQGQIVEQGSHQELLDEDGLYASLWRRQSGGFLPLE